MCSGAFQVKSVLRTSGLWLRCWSLHKHWLLAARKAPYSGEVQAGVGGKSKKTNRNQQAAFPCVVSLCLYNEHIAPNRKSSSGPLGWTSPAQEWREGGWVKTGLWCSQDEGSQVRGPGDGMKVLCRCHVPQWRLQRQLQVP